MHQQDDIFWIVKSVMEASCTLPEQPMYQKDTPATSQTTLENFQSFGSCNIDESDDERCDSTDEDVSPFEIEPEEDTTDETDGRSASRLEIALDCIVLLTRLRERLTPTQFTLFLALMLGLVVLAIVVFGYILPINDTNPIPSVVVDRVLQNPVKYENITSLLA